MFLSAERLSARCIALIPAGLFRVRPVGSLGGPRTALFDIGQGS
jgi:hypothetical protein